MNIHGEADVHVPNKCFKIFVTFLYLLGYRSIGLQLVSVQVATLTRIIIF